MKKYKRKHLFRKSIPSNDLRALLTEKNYEATAKYKDLIEIRLIKKENIVEVITSSKLPIKNFVGACSVNSTDIIKMYAHARKLMVYEHWRYMHGNQIQSRR